MSCHTLHIMSKCMVQRLNFAFPCHTPCMLCFNKSVAYSKCHTLAIVGGIGTSSQLQITNTPPPHSPGSLLTSDPHCHSNGPILKWREFPPLLETGLEDVIVLLPLVPTLKSTYLIHINKDTVKSSMKEVLHSSFPDLRTRTRTKCFMGTREQTTSSHSQESRKM